MKNETETVAAVLPADLPKGSYTGIWSGNIVAVNTGQAELNLLVKDGRPGAAECSVKVDNSGNVIVKTKS